MESGRCEGTLQVCAPQFSGMGEEEGDKGEGVEIGRGDGDEAKGLGIISASIKTAESLEDERSDDKNSVESGDSIERQ